MILWTFALWKKKWNFLRSWSKSYNECIKRCVDECLHGSQSDIGISVSFMAHRFASSRFSVSELPWTEDNTCSSNHNVPIEVLSWVNELLDYFIVGELFPDKILFIINDICIRRTTCFLLLFAFCSSLCSLIFLFSVLSSLFSSLVGNILFMALLTVWSKATIMMSQDA